VSGLKRPGAILVFLLLLIVFAILLAPRVIQVQSLKIRSENLEIELRKIKQENQNLETQLRLLREDPVYLEKVARVKFNKAKQGEIVYKVVREGETSQTQ
jgi:cell division protein FtsB